MTLRDMAVNTLLSGSSSRRLNPSLKLKLTINITTIPTSFIMAKAILTPVTLIRAKLKARAGTTTTATTVIAVSISPGDKLRSNHNNLHRHHHQPKHATRPGSNSLDIYPSSNCSA